MGPIYALKTMIKIYHDNLCKVLKVCTDRNNTAPFSVKFVLNLNIYMTYMEVIPSSSIGAPPAVAGVGECVSSATVSRLSSTRSCPSGGCCYLVCNEQIFTIIS